METRPLRWGAFINIEEESSSVQKVTPPRIEATDLLKKTMRTSNGNDQKSAC